MLGKPGTTGGPAVLYLKGTGSFSWFDDTIFGSGAAHSSQNFARGVFSCWHRGHFKLVVLARAPVAMASDGRREVYKTRERFTTAERV